MIRGATPTAATLMMRAKACKRCVFSAAADASSNAQAPSFMPEALPAVMVLSVPKSGFSLASCSSVILGRGCSSSSTMMLSLPLLICTAVISSARQPSARARAVRCWLRNAYASWQSRVMPCSRARLSAVCVIESTPYRDCITGLMQCHPSVLSSSFCSRVNAASALGMTNGARDILSTPPAITNSASPPAIARAA